MKTLLPLLLALLLPFAAAAEDPKVAALTTVDDARVAAMLKPSKATLDTVLSDDLRYAHSNGKVDTKASLTSSLLGGEAQVALVSTGPSLQANSPAPYAKGCNQAVMLCNGSTIAGLQSPSLTSVTALMSKMLIQVDQARFFLYVEKMALQLLRLSM